MEQFLEIYEPINEFNFELKITINNTKKKNFMWLSNMDHEITISDIKFLISIFWEIQYYNQILKYGECILDEDEKTLGNYNISTTSEIFLEILN